MVFEQFKERPVVLEHFADQEIQRTVGGFEFIAQRLAAFDFRQNLCHLRRTLFELDPERFGLEQDVALAGKLRDQDVLRVADFLRADVFVAAGEFLDGVDVDASLVGEGRGPHVGSADVVLAVGQFVHKKRQLAQARQVGGDRDAHFELQVGHDGGEIAVAHALAVAVDGPLDLHRSGAHRRQGVCDGHSRVVVRVDSHGFADPGDHVAGDPFHLVGHGAAVGVAKRRDVGSACHGGKQGAQGVFRVFLVAVEEMFGVVADFAPVGFEIGDAFRDHRAVFLRRDV